LYYLLPGIYLLRD